MSLRLRSRTTLPPNGILYTQKETGWVSHVANPNSQWDFKLCAREIQRHRLSNPGLFARLGISTDLGAIEDELDRTNALRVSAIPNADIYLMQGGAPPPKQLAPPSQKRLAAVAGAVKKIQAGVDLLLDWEESGESPVAPDLSARRATICATCPKNGRSALTEWFTVPASELIKRRIARLNDLKLSTPSDGQINICTACLCPLKLKVHTPIHIVLKHLLPEAKADLDPRCWILNEAKS